MKNLLAKQGVLLMCFVVLSFSFNGQAQSMKKMASLKEDSKTAKAEFIEADWRMEDRFNEAHGYVIFPNVGKGGLGVGGAAGNGIVYEGGQQIGAAKLTQLSIGFQAGGQAYREIIFFEDKEAMDRFKGNNFEFSAQASAVAVTAGASAKADYEDGVMVFTMQKGGLMYEASIGGQKFKYDAF
jgi:lipid-binding SYLF domain-containing protein